jgi:hypothetical protein
MSIISRRAVEGIKKTEHRKQKGKSKIRKKNAELQIKIQKALIGGRQAIATGLS